jgi:hypothetical protein
MAYLDKKFTKSNHTIDKSSLSLSSTYDIMQACSSANSKL